MNIIGEELKEKFHIGDIVLTNPFNDDYLGIILNISESKLGNRWIPSAKVFVLEEKEVKEFLLEVLRISKGLKNENY